MSPSHLLRLARVSRLLAVCLGSSVPAFAAAAPAAEAPIELTPFEVTADPDDSYQATNTLGATRVNTPIRDLPMQINVVTEQMMADFAAFDMDQVLDLIPGTGRTFNEFIPQLNVRGFDSSAAMRNGVRGLSSPDMNTIARVETIKGPAALLYGQTQPGGVVNYITKNPSPIRRTTLRLSAGSNALYRAELDATGPLKSSRTLNYRLGLAYYENERGERERSLNRTVFTPMLQWRPFSGTSLTLRYSNMHDNQVPSGGLSLKPTGAVNRGGSPELFAPFLNLDPVHNPHWVDDVGPGYIKDSPSSFRDQRNAVWEIEGTQKLNRYMDLRLNLAHHHRMRTSVREGGTALLNPWLQTNPTIASLGGFNSYNLDNTRGDPFPESLHVYGLIGRGGVPSAGVDPLSDTRLLNGRPYVFDPAVPTLAYVPGVSGWRRTGWIGNYRRERRYNGQIDLVSRFKLGPLQNTLLTGLEHNEDRVWSNDSTLVRSSSLGTGGAALYTLPGTTIRIPNSVDYWYNIYSAASTAARDEFARRNLPPLEGFTSNRGIDDTRTTSNALYLNWSASFLRQRGRISAGGRYDEISARVSEKDGGTNALTFDGQTTSSIEGERTRVTPQAGMSFRVVDPVTAYVLYSRSINPRVNFQPGRTAARETQLLTRYSNEGLPAPDLNAYPWGQLLEPEYGESMEFGLKTDLFENRVMFNIAWFTIDKKNISRAKPADDPDSAGGFLDLSGAERARGVDLDFYLRPTRDLLIGGGLLFNQTEILAINPANLALPYATTFAANNGPSVRFPTVGMRINNAPEWSGTGYVRYQFSAGSLRGLSLGAQYNYMGERREAGNVTRWSESWRRLNLTAGYRTRLLGRSTSFNLVVRNVLDEHFRVNRDTLAQGTTYVGTVSFEL